ncbi:hypothetical protein D9619_002460 [Psilocybe cf. subviscida]|uniref:F-box domain-containing protein n=1 Tax=Psilocybe cf. subviscida TaxID=2480587 RepID=A0A8H5AWF2_9AGAR|nr:hypothetical protein D9619_002460 [Psilocybe cf. subviscida]
MPCHPSDDCSGCKDIEILDLEVLEATQALERVAQRRRAIVYAQNQKHDRFIQGMPVEIATLILGLDVEQSIATNPSRPLQLAAVCKGWRELALATSSLWSSMACRRQGWPWRFPVDLVELWIERAGRRRMNITVSWDPRKLVGPFLNIPLTRTAGEGLGPLLNIIENHRDAVKHLVLKVPHVSLELLPSGHFQSFQKTTQIGLQLLTFPPHMQEFNKSLRISPTKLVVEGMVVLSECGELLRRCCSVITYCHLRRIVNLSFGPPPPTASLDTIHLLNLQHLHLTLMKSAVTPNFFQPFDTPRLRNLHIHLFSSGPTNSTLSFPPITSFIARLSATLQELSLQFDSVITEAQIVGILSGLPLLVKFYLHIDDDNQDIPPTPTSSALMMKLAETGTNVNAPEFLPRLQDLRVRQVSVPSWSSVADMFTAHSKLDSARPLKTMEISPGRGLTDIWFIDKDSLLRLLVLPANNLKFTIDHPCVLRSSILHHGLDTSLEVLTYYNI